jgi:hypothetical protein
MRSKQEKIKFDIKDLEYLYQYIILHYNTIKYYKNLQLLIVKKREEIFDFIKILDKNFIKKSALVYVTEDVRHNFSVFDSETYELLYTPITKELIDYLRITIDNKKLFKRIDTTFKGFFKNKAIIFFVFVLVLYGIIYIL